VADEEILPAPVLRIEDVPAAQQREHGGLAVVCYTVRGD
jgi:hypothetical protein